MHANWMNQKVLIFTESERIEGTIRHGQGIRLSDYFNASVHRENPFVNLCEATVTSLKTGEIIFEGDFFMLARTRITMVMPGGAEPIRNGRPSEADQRIGAELQGARAR
jgi:hypothetical protein